MTFNVYISFCTAGYKDRENIYAYNDKNVLEMIKIRMVDLKTVNLRKKITKMTIRFKPKMVKNHHFASFFIIRH